LLNRRSMRRRPASWLALITLVAACGGSSKAPSCESLAETIEKCDAKTTQADWLGLCSLAVLSDDCRKAISSASCAEHAKPVPSYQATCFPACSTSTTAVCDGAAGTVVQCVPALGGLVTYRCTAVCGLTNKQYAGTCGTAYGGQSSASGQPVCWCQ